MRLAFPWRELQRDAGNRAVSRCVADRPGALPQLHRDGKLYEATKNKPVAKLENNVML